MADSNAAPLLRMSGITKSYGGVRALQDVHFEANRGTIHALLGENGAGKSTLIKVLSGVVRPDSGSIELDGKPVRFANPTEANDAGIACIFQELSLLPDLTVADNIGITRPPKRFGLIDFRAQRRLAEEALARVGGESIHPSTTVRELPLSRRQMVEIAKALARDPKILILDEATSALTAADVEKVFVMLNRLREEGMAIIYISHRMNEIAELADVCTVCRNGQKVETFMAGTRSDNAIVEMMIGREYESVFPPKAKDKPDVAPILKVRNLSWQGELNGIDLDIRPGEIVGLGGLDGQGQRQLLLGLFGTLIGTTGTVEIGGRKVNLTSPKRAKSGEIGMALIPEDRKAEGLMLPMTVRENLSFAAVEKVSRFGIVDLAAEERAIDDMVALLKIKAAGIDGPVGALSGGNQQKVVIGKWLMTKPSIILLNDPTRGIDVGTKQEIYQLLQKLAADGAAILFYSTDYDELIGCCDRVLVMYGGKVVRSLAGSQLNETNLVSAALNLPAGTDELALAAHAREAAQ
ncbi:sugar ABC transporter ATP-binding protein [Oricola thermophila]|uniref:Sugar ABC transporter ATP-binding protein n=1 Tax=Oricola thermophila TaxID=2742145 RepID=A0A6N1VNX2_9HYPH|nr:sugar ABC transporter ATP-binding protein [Oricola thermophila]QKV20637.1 sugar ABC transporter ATP-binding protein [Oricola thermophila]